MRSLRTSSLQPIALNAGGLVAGLVAAWVVVTLPRPMGVALGPALVVGLAALLLPAVAPILLVASVPVQEAGAVALGGVALTATKLALGLAVALALVHLVTARRAIHGSWLLVPYLAYLTTMAISLHGARDTRAGLAEMYRWGVTLAAFVLVTNFVRSRRAVLGLAGLVALGPLAEVGLGVVQSVQRLGPSSYAVTASLYRAFGTFGMPNTYAGYLEMTGPWLGALAVWALVRTARALHRYRSVRLQGMVASQQ
ncbi:MAG: O-antigen ligase family protein, partial [Thermomicrobiaceae bacterium]|nr:O-antigen ligase family protein [Thermomicrobiaceae bacterium]